MIDVFVPNTNELAEQGAKGDYDKIMNDTYEEVALMLKTAGANVDVNTIDVNRRRRPWFRTSYGEGYVTLGNQRYQVGPIKASEVYAFYSDLMGLFGAYNVDVHTSTVEFQILKLAQRYAWELFKWFRVVREKADLTYAGPMTVGNGIVLDKILPADFDKTDWLFTTSVGANDYLGTSASPMTLAKNAGFAFFALIDEVAVEGQESPVNQMKVSKNGVDYIARGLNFRTSDGIEDNRGVFTFVPNDTVYIQINATAAKASKFHPIGVVLVPVEKAKTLGQNRIKA